MQTSKGLTKQVPYYHFVLYLWVVPSSIVLLLEDLPISSSSSVGSIFLLNTDISMASLLKLNAQQKRAWMGGGDCSRTLFRGGIVDSGVRYA